MTTFSVKEALGFGWGKTKKHFWFIVSVVVGYVIASFLLNLAPRDRDFVFPLSLIVFLLSFMIGIALEVGVLRITLKILDDVRGGLDDFLPGWDLFLRMVGVSILYTLIVGAGLILLIVPGIIWALKYYFATYLVIDKGMRPIEALRASGKMTDGNKGKLLLFWFVGAGVILLGIIALGIGLLWAAPTVMIATAYIYRKILGKGQEELPLGEVK